MKTKVARYYFLVTALVLTTGCVTSRTPVGDKVATLEPGVWNARWRDAGGDTVRTKIKDANLGLVQFTTRHSLLKPAETGEVLVRTLGPLTIANQKIGDVYYFQRIAIDYTSLVAFNSNESLFESLIKHHQIGGKIDKDVKGKPAGSCTIEGLSEKDYQRLKERGIDVQSIFDDDPSRVLIRYKWSPF